MKTIPRSISVAALAALPGMAAAQGLMISGSSSAQYVELRPLAIDSVRYADTDSAWGSYRLTNSGILARCVGSSTYCTYFRSASRQSMTAMMQDLDVTGWGFGQGVSVHAPSICGRPNHFSLLSPASGTIRCRRSDGSAFLAQDERIGACRLRACRLSRRSRRRAKARGEGAGGERARRSHARGLYASRARASVNATGASRACG